jgi:hypothetical protein
MIREGGRRKIDRPKGHELVGEKEKLQEKNSYRKKRLFTRGSDGTDK